MNWDIEIADAAYEDMRNIFLYIANELHYSKTPPLRMAFCAFVEALRL